MLRKRVRNPRNDKYKRIVLPLHVDMISPRFWEDNAEIIQIKSPRIYDLPEGTPLHEFVTKQLNSDDEP